MTIDSWQQDINSIGISAVKREEVDAVLTLGYNVIQIDYLQASSEYCVFLSPQKLADTIISTIIRSRLAFTEEHNLDDRFEYIRQLIVKTFSQTNYAVMNINYGNTLEVNLQQVAPMLSDSGNVKKH